MPSVLRKQGTLIALCLVLLVAGFTRLYDVNFDDNTHQHPDERFITQVTIDRVNIPGGTALAQLFDPARSPINPRINGQAYHYGAFPLYLVKAVAAAGASLFHHADWLGYDGLVLVGRTVAGLFDVFTVLLVFLIARRLYGSRAGLLAAAFSALAVTQIQIAHFYIAEPFLVTFLTATLYFAVVLMQNRRPWAAALAGLCLGFGLACKVSVAPMALLIVAAVLLRLAYRTRTRQLGPPVGLDDPHGLDPATREERTAPFGVAARRAFLLLVIAGATTLGGFLIGDPFGVLDSGLHVSLNANDAFAGTVFLHLGPLELGAPPGKYLAQLGEEAAIQQGTSDAPYTRQYIGTVPILYHLQQLIQWGMGPASGLVALAGLLLAFYLALRRRPAELLLLAGLVPYFLTIVTLEAKWMRYMLPLVPYMCILGAGLLVRGLQWSAVARDRLATWREARRRAPAGWQVRRFAFPVLTALALLGSAAWATAFMNIYTHEHSRVIASRWMINNLTPGTKLGHETWDDALPLIVGDEVAKLARAGKPVPSWGAVDMGLYDDRPSPEEFTYIAGLLDQTDYIVLASNRLYGSIPHTPWRYPVQMRYYDLLLSNKLGFEQVLPPADQKVYPELFGIRINDDHADESFTVYDHPHVLVFKKTRSLTKDDLHMLFGSSVDRPSIPTRRLAHPTAKDYDKSLMLDQPAGEQLVLGDYAWNALAQNQWVALLLWVLAVEVLGLLAWPLMAVVARRLPDRGYPLSKTLALVVVAWITWLLASLHLAPFTVWSVLGAIVALAAIAAILWRRFGPELWEYVRSHRRLILGWEALFAVAFLAFLGIRILNPDFWHPWRGGEKPMEFGFLNAVLRSPWMPPGDPFFSSGYINYYYYGWFILGTLIKLIGMPPAIGFNLALPLLFGLTFTGGASVVYNAVVSVQRARGWRGAGSRTAFGWGVLAAVLLVAIGNLTFLLQFISMHFPAVQRAAVDFMARFGPVSDSLKHSFVGGYDYWSGASRVIDPAHTINEFPYWTFLFADLHPHLIDLSFSLLALGLLLNLLLGAWRWPVFRPLSGEIATATVPAVPAPGVYIREGRPYVAAAFEAGHRLWGSSPVDGALRFATLALALGTLFAVNSWDFPVYLALGAGIVLIATFAAWQGHAARGLVLRVGTMVAALAGIGLVAVASLVVYAPFVLDFKPFYNQIKAIGPDMRRTDLPEFLVVWGLFVLIGFTYLILSLRQYPWRVALGDWRRWFVPSGFPAPAPAYAILAPAAPAASQPLRPRPVPSLTTTPLPVARGVPLPDGVLAASAANGHRGTVAAPLPVPVHAGVAEDRDEYGLGDIAAPVIDLDDEPARVRRDWLTALDDYDAPFPDAGNGHGSAPLVADGDGAHLHNGSHPAAAPRDDAHPQSGNGTSDAPSLPADRQLPAGNGADDDWLLADPHLHVGNGATGSELDLRTGEVDDAHTGNGFAAVAPPETESLADLAGEAATPTAQPADSHGFVAYDPAGPGEGGAATERAPGAEASATGVQDAGVIPLPPEASGAPAGALATQPSLPVASPRPSPAARAVTGLLPAGAGLPVFAVTVIATVLFLLARQGLEAMLVLLIGGLVGTHLSSVRAPGRLFGGWLIASGFAIALGVEYIYLADHLENSEWYRMNTVFKFYEQIWVLLACGAGVALYSLLGPRGESRRPLLAAAAPAIAPGGVEVVAPDPVLGMSEITDVDPPLAPATPVPAAIQPVAMRLPGRAWLSPARALWLLPFGILLIGSLIFTVAGTQARVAERMPGSQPPVGTLNGMDWMDKSVITVAFDSNTVTGPLIFTYERQALDWLNSHVPGTPVVAEAPFGYYLESGMMVGAYTGIPIVVGGLHQEEQRYDWLVGERRNDITNFYRTTDIGRALLIIQKYDIAYIYVGQLENLYYRRDAGGLAKFKDMAGKYLDVAYQNDLVTIYRVQRRQVASDIGSAPGSVVVAPTPRPQPTEPPLGDDPALKGLLAAVKADSNNLDAHRALADYYRTHGAVARAIEEYIVVNGLAPHDVAAHHILGDLYMQSGEPDKALAAWEEAVRQASDSDKAPAYNKLGVAYSDRQRYDEALKAFQAAVAANPAFVEASFHLGEVYLTLQDNDHARAAFQNTIKNAPPGEEGAQHWAAEAQKRLDGLR